MSANVRENDPFKQIEAEKRVSIQVSVVVPVISVGVPPDELLFLRTRDEEAEVLVKGGAELQFGGSLFGFVRSAPRGAMEASLREGLFLMPYGPGYYAVAESGARPDVAGRFGCVARDVRDLRSPGWSG